MGSPAKSPCVPEQPWPGLQASSVKEGEGDINTKKGPDHFSFARYCVSST